MKEYPRILTIQDISCLGQCSATVALPILSACGCEACILPTMVLSTHTGGLGIPTRRDLTGDIRDICAHWVSQKILFDGIYVGYLGKKEQISHVLDAIPSLLAPDGLLIVDPAMADHGRLYSGLDEAYRAEMGRLCAKADILIPNWTEACMLLGEPCEQAYEETILCRLQALCGGSIVLTGVSDGEDRLGAAVFDGREVVYTYHRKLPGAFHGTGDMFAAVLVGKHLHGASLAEAARSAGEFVCQAIANTIREPAHGYGVKFETALPLLWK